MGGGRMAGSGWDRRRFLKVLGTTAAAVGLSEKTFGETAAGVCVVADSADAVVAAKPAAWALERLTQAFKTRGVAVTRVARWEHSASGSLCVVAAGAASPVAARILSEGKVSVAAAPEALGIVVAQEHGRRVLLACGYDALGLVYALTELVDVVDWGADAVEALAAVETTVERPANAVRSMMRSFCSDVEDKPWFNDRAMWPLYFDMLAAQGFNRLNLAFWVG